MARDTVTADPAQTSYTAGQVVTLTATAAPNHTFTGWSGAVTGTTNPITLTMDSDKVVTATFALNTHELTILKTGTGDGSVVSIPAGIACGASCTAAFSHGTLITLTATADTGSTFTGWSGPLTSTNPTITVTLEMAMTITAEFALEPTPPTSYRIFLPLVVK
ncbi:MAG: hypothetical protein IPL28_08555 [Chloroflexi bacterium]|nr:hypothetical protein [Chloroflexota bacterium]